MPRTRPPWNEFVLDQPAIETRDLTKTYIEGWLRRKRQPALKGVSLRVERGEIFGLLGGNGAGKTTFIKTLLGIIRKSGGDANMLGFPAGDRRGRKLVGYLPENLRVPRHLTGYSALEYYGNLSNVPTSVVRRRRGLLFEKVGLAERAKDPVRTYSKGMLQRLGLAQAMLHDPELFILDEPTDGLDPLARSQVRGYLKELKEQGKTIFLNSHILQEVELICDRVAILDKGVLRRVAHVAEITSGRDGIRAGGNGQPDGQPSELELHLDLTGDEQAIRETLGALPIANWQAFSSSDFRVVARVPQQAEVNQLIDRLRDAGVSIIGLSRRRVSLEDAYLEIVAEAAKQLMRPYIAIIKDSFREALASRVLWVFTGVIVLVLLALAPLGYQHNLTSSFAWGDIVDAPQFAERLKQDGEKERPSPGKRIWTLLDDDAKKKIEALANAGTDEKRREREGRVIMAGMGALRTGLNKLIERRDFYDPDVWSDVSLPKEAKDFLSRGADKLPKSELMRLNRLAIEAAFPAHFNWRPNDSISIAYAGIASDPLPFSKKQIDSFIMEWVLTTAMDWIVGVFGLIAALLITSNVIPQMFEPGSITLLLSKPVSRSLLFTSKFLGACAFVFLNVTLLIVGLWLIVGMRFDIWNAGMLTCIPVFLFMFLVYYAVSALTGLVWKSAIISVVITVLFWIMCFVVDLTHGILEGGILEQQRITRIVQADDALLAVTEGGDLQIWDEEAKQWREASEKRNGPGIPTIDGPYYHTASKQLVAGLGFRNPFGGSAQRISLRVANAAGGWKLTEGPSLPSGTAKIVIANDGSLLAIAADNIFRYEGDLAAKGTAIRIFGMRLPLLGGGEFKPCLSGERPSFADPIAAAFDPVQPRLVVCAANDVYLFAQQDDGSFQETARRSLDSKDKQGSAVAVAGDVVFLAREDGKLRLLSADDLSDKQELTLEANSQPRFVAASRDGSQFGVVFQNHFLWLIDAKTGAARRAPISAQGQISGIAFTDNRLLVGDYANRLVAYDAATLSYERTYRPPLSRYELAYYYGIEPLHMIFPKPRRLHKTVQYLITGKRTTDLGFFQGDLTQLREDLHPWQPVQSGLVFLGVVLLAACVYMERQEF